MSGVSFDQVSKVFDGVTAVDSISFDIADGEFMVLLGPSGCGKSTALRMIAGLEDVSSGILSIGERVVNHIPPKERDIAMVFQSYALYPHMTVQKNIESPLIANRGNRVSPEERQKRVDFAASTLGLTEYLGRKPGALSGGQRQRVALARAIVRRPEVFLMDEPLSNLDAKLRTQTRIELVELHRQLGTTFVYVTHDQVEAMTMADRIAVMNEGRLQQVGPPQEVYERPANLFVAHFIGSPPMNSVAGVVSRVGDTTSVSTQAGNFNVDFPGQVTNEQSVVAGFRPENLRLTRDDPTGLIGTVENVEMLGHERHVIVQVADAYMTIRESHDAKPAHIGEQVHLVPDPAQVHLFDAETTERVN